jgi:hypothetical protein
MDPNKATAGQTPPSTTRGQQRHSFLHDPCCFSVLTPGFDDDEDIPMLPTTGANTNHNNNNKMVDSDNISESGSTEHPFDEDVLSSNGTEVAICDTSKNTISDAIPGNDMTSYENASPDTVLQYPIASVNESDDLSWWRRIKRRSLPVNVLTHPNTSMNVQEDSEKEDGKSIIENDQGEGLSWWRHNKQRNANVLTHPISSMDVQEEEGKSVIENDQDKDLPWWRHMKQRTLDMIPHRIASMDVQEDPEIDNDPENENDPDNEDETSVIENDQDKGLLWWRRMKQRNLVLLTLVNIVIFIIIVSLIGKHAKRSNRETVSSTSADGSTNKDGNDNDNDNADNIITSSSNNNSNTNDTKNNTSSFPKGLPCSDDGATPGNGIVLTPNAILQFGQFICSPSQEFMVGISSNLDGDLVVYETATNQVIWNANVTGAERLVMQQDGNIVLEDDGGAALYSTEFEPLRSSTWDGSLVVQLVISDDGLLTIEQVVSEENSSSSVMLWIEGTPNVTAGPFEDITFPVRGTFYYATYKDQSSWEGSRFQPSLGSYSSSDPVVIQNHVAAFKYGKMDLVILSWLGQDAADTSHRPRTRMLLDETVKQDAPIKWTFYYESAANRGDPSLDVIQRDLEYLKTWFTWDQTWAHMNGKPVLFVNNGGGCDVSARWMQATNNEWYIVLRSFDGFEYCEIQPDSWHEQRDSDDTNGADHSKGYYFNLSPGEWLSGSDEPTIERMTGSLWCFYVKEMVDSGEPWQLIVSFNNAETGTSIESSLEWESDSGYGLYLDCLNNNRFM